MTLWWLIPGIPGLNNRVPVMPFAGDPEDGQLEATLLPLLRSLATASDAGYGGVG